MAEHIDSYGGERHNRGTLAIGVGEGLDVAAMAERRAGDDGPSRPDMAPSATFIPDRNRRIRLAVATSVGSKISTALLQIVAYPIALAALGPERFGIFALIYASLAWVMVANSGPAAGLVNGLAATADRHRQAGYVTAGLAITAGVIAGVGAAIGLWIFGARWSPVAAVGTAGLGDEVGQAVIVTAGIVLGLLLTQTIEAVRSGLQENHITNACNIVGNGLAAVSLIAVAMAWPTISGIIVAVYGSRLVAGLLNGVLLFGATHADLRPRRGSFRWRLVRELVVAGAAFSIIQACAFLTNQGGLIILGQSGDGRVVARYAALLQLLQIGWGLVFMLLTPMWPALRHAVASHDHGWMRRAVRAMNVFALVSGGMGGLLIAGLAPYVVAVWMSAEVAPAPTASIFAGAYFALVVWRSTQYTALIGFAGHWVAAVLMVLDSLLFLIVAIASTTFSGESSIWVAHATAALLVSAWAMPLMLRRKLAAFHRASSLILPPPGSNERA